MFGKRLGKIRKLHNETQEDLANALGCSVHTVRTWEQEKFSPNYATLVTICERYHVSADYLLGLVDDIIDYTNRNDDIMLPAEDSLALQEYKEFLLWKRTHPSKK